MRRVTLGVLMFTSISLGPAARAEAPKTDGVRAIVAFDTAKGPAGTGVSQIKMDWFLEWMRANGIPVEVTLISGEEISPSGIIAAIRGLDAPSLKTRTLFFYYGGHGATDVKGGTGHFLRTPKGDLSRAVIVAEVLAKAPALAVVITDSCSVEARMDGPGPVIPISSDVRAAENLFLQHRGLVDLNSSTYDRERGVGQAAFYHPRAGGLFTTSFTSMFLPDTRFLNENKPGPIWRYDADKDGFHEWSEAMEHLRADTTRNFEQLQTEVTEGRLRLLAAPADVRLIQSQLGQDPQAFGPLARRSDRAPAPEQPKEAPKEARKVRLGAYFRDRTGLGGGAVEVVKVDPGSPATKAVESRAGRKLGQPSSLPPGLLITRANDRRVRNRAELNRVIDQIPEGQELNVFGYRDVGGKRTSYEATVVLDRFE